MNKRKWLALLLTSGVLLETSGCRYYLEDIFYNTILNSIVSQLLANLLATPA